jgi:hypothetical protein
VLANAGGAVGGALAGTFLSAPCLSMFAYLGLAVAYVVSWLVFTLTVSWAQQAAIWSYSDMTWLRNSTFGGVIAIVLGTFAGGGVLLSPIGWLPVGALGGLIIGLAQWPVLREELSTSYARTWPWVPANAVGMSVGMAGGQAAFTFMFGEQGLVVPSNLQLLDYIVGLIVNPLARATIAVALAAVITGGALLLIQRQRQASVAG